MVNSFVKTPVQLPICFPSVDEANLLLFKNGEEPLE